MSDELSDDDLEQLMSQAEDDLRSDPELTEAVRTQLSSQLDGLVERILHVLEAERRDGQHPS